MRTIAVLTAMFALLCAPAASAHFLPHHKHLTATERVAYFERSIRHDRRSIGLSRRMLAARPGRDVAAVASRGLRWHRAALHWHLDLYRRARRALPVYTGDFNAATWIVGRFYGDGVRSWLAACSSGEGGHGVFVWIGHASHAIYGTNTPGGWMQFMQSTFDSNAGWAFADARARGLRVDVRARSYWQPLGQAVVAGAMYAHGGNPGTWTGSGC